MINLDGEYGGDAPMTFINHHHHIEMYANLDAIPDDAVVGYEEEEAEYEEVSRDFIKEVEKLTDEDIDGDGQIADQNDKK